MTATLDYVRQLAATAAIASARTKRTTKSKEWWEVGPYRHRGVAYYDKQRMAKQLPRMPESAAGDGYGAPPSWAQLPASWGEWEKPRANYFHSTWQATETTTSEAATVNETAEYTLTRNPDGYGMGYRAETSPERRVLNSVSGEWKTIPAVVEWLFRSLPWTLTFADGTSFDFASRAIAESALPELLKIRKGKHQTMPAPRSVHACRSTNATYFTAARLRKLPADATPDTAAEDTQLADDDTELEAA